MSEPTELLVSLLLYPGFLTTLILSLLVAKIANVPAPGGGLTRGLIAAITGRGSALLLLCAAAPLVAPALLPWPGTSVTGANLIRNVWLFWAIIESSSLLALVPGLRTGSPHGVRAAIREAQLGTAGRLCLWVAIGIGLWAELQWTAYTIVGLTLALFATALALPVATGWGPFSADQSLTPGGPEAALSRADAQLAQWGRAIRATTLLMLVPLLLVPSIPDIHWAINSALAINIILVLATVGRLINGSSVRRPLLDGLHWCWWRVLPLTALAAIALLIGRNWK